MDPFIIPTTDPREPLRVAVYCQTLWNDIDLIGFQKTVIADTLRRCADVPPILTIYVDNGFCANTQVRPDFHRLLLDVAARKIDVIAVCEWGRLATGEADIKQLLRYFYKHDVLVVECETKPARLVLLAA
ncbi:recombinase family protein [Lysobacter sp. CA199]|uniref:recombinase family protein n=1 Tax=Lysobacter sp. CA199 TaxID=3455608 RepID=UPI003F8D4C3F